MQHQCRKIYSGSEQVIRHHQRRRDKETAVNIEERAEKEV
jgi:hypothetical protein